jgi:organic radical activating enzyme
MFQISSQKGFGHKGFFGILHKFNLQHKAGQSKRMQNVLLQKILNVKDTKNIQYPVMEHFQTIQGEGFHSGRAAYFIRLGGCDVGCHWCDVKESWPIDAHPKMAVAQLVERVLSTGLKLAVITGGEPAMHNLQPLTDGLRAAGIDTHIETSGAHPLTGDWDWVTFSPKKFKAPLSAIYAQADELKVVIYHKSDLQFAEEHRSKLASDALLYLQPEWGKRNASMELIVSYIAAHPEWRVSLQTHKYLEIP